MRYNSRFLLWFPSLRFLSAVSEHVMFGWFTQRKRKRLLAEPFPDEWEGTLVRNVWQYAWLSEQQQARLRDCVTLICHERRFEACGGLELDDEMRVTIAGQAALLILGVKGYYFERLPSILIYPESYVRPGGSQVGRVVHEDLEFAGEAWQGGPIVLSWDDVLAACYRHSGHHHVVIHEFAHHIDSLDGEMEGMPPLDSTSRRERWRRVRDREFERLQQALDWGEETFIDPYGAQNEAEFFAVSSERFFNHGAEMSERHPEWYEVLSDFYRVDPSAWEWT